MKTVLIAMAAVVLATSMASATDNRKSGLGGMSATSQAAGTAGKQVR